MRTWILGLVFGIAGLLLAPPAEAQPARQAARVGVLLFSTLEGDPNLAALRRGLSELGYIEGKNLTLVYRYADGKPERLPALAGELAGLAPDLIFALGGDVAPSAKAATNSIPIVIAVSNDPVQAGLVASLARPGGAQATRIID